MAPVDAGPDMAALVANFADVLSGMVEEVRDEEVRDDVANAEPARNPKPAISYKDVNSDGELDLTAFFSVEDLVDAGVLSPTTAAVTLRAKLFDGAPFQGTGSVRVISQ